MPTETPPIRHRTNPFTTRSTRPGALPPLDTSGIPRDLTALLDRLAQTPAAAIVGPHGTGKTTLLIALEGALAATGRSAGLLRLRRRSDALLVLRTVARARRGTAVCVDGWERAGPLAAAATRLAARFRGCRLVVTSHRPTGMTTIATTSGTFPLLGSIVARLPDHAGLITPDDLAEAFARHGGNLRDSLDELYDRFERRARRS